jgi:hypothetical protein
MCRISFPEIEANFLKMKQLRTTLIIGLTLFLFASPFLGSSFAASNNRNTSIVSTPISRPSIQGVTSFYSYNWAGYAVSSAAGSVTAVNGSWTEPSVTCNPSAKGLQDVSFWVGIDGFSDSTVEQDGTSAFCAMGSSTPQVTAWYEIYPLEAEINIKQLKVSPGDVMDAGVSYSAVTQEFTMWIKDATTGHTFSISQAEPAAQLSSAEWITEEPAFCSSTICRFALLTDYGTASFGTGSMNTATVSGVTAPIGDWGTLVYSLTCVTYPYAHLDMDTPGLLYVDNSHFNMQWLNAGTGAVITL